MPVQVEEIINPRQAEQLQVENPCPNAQLYYY